MKFRKKPVIVEAFRYGVDPMPDWFMDKVTSKEITLWNRNYLPQKVWYCEISTLEGKMHGAYMDFIIQGVNGEIYPCKPDIFAKTYEPVDNLTKSNIVNIIQQEEI